MPIESHPSFVRPPVTVPLWRYTDLAKFVDLLTSQRIWLSNLEVLATDDPYEGSPWPVLFPHRMWKTIDELPATLREQIIQIYGRAEKSPEELFKGWFCLQEQASIFAQFGRRQYYVNCWHAAPHESVAMWKIYGAPGAGIAIVTNGGRLGEALASSPDRLFLGAVRYLTPGTVEIGTRNSFDTVVAKGASYEYEREVRLVYWDTEDRHDPLANDAWNEETMRFDDIIDDPRPVTPGRLLNCDVAALIDRVVVSPYAPPWYKPMIEKLRDQLKFEFPVAMSNLSTPPQLLP